MQPVRVTTSIPAIKLHNSQFDFPNGLGRIEYICDPEVVIWGNTQASEKASVHLSTLEVSSGGGKTTLMNLAFDFLQGKINPHSGFFPSPAVPLRVAYIPQKPNIIRHWKAHDLVPEHSGYLRSMFSDKPPSLKAKRLSSFSGGQVSRIFVASALHRLEATPHPVSYLLLDEALEGIEETLLVASLTGIGKQWQASNPGRQLFILFVTHLQMNAIAPSLIEGNIDLRRIVLVRQASQFEGASEIIPVIIKALGN